MSSDGTRGELLDARATLDLWRECGADRVNPVRFHFMDALDRRAAAYSGQPRQLLDEKLARLIQAYEADLDSAAAQPGAAGLPASPERGPLAALIDDIANPASADGNGPAGRDDAMGLRAGYPEVQMLDYFRAVWSRVSADRQVRQSQEQVHKNAGPLNSNQLVHRALSLMRELSPGYLQQFLSYTDALMWMEQMAAATAPPAKDAPRAGAAKKTARGKAR
ncbi:DUF2894 domain-containing protein [Achromobacter sp. NPDC058515]|uniref:DUF2894 domain-containing protein n=1 Tax=Achromobacter sp. NPDC058515 TaxID=3346533 RepID=UPI0036542479